MADNARSQKALEKEEAASEDAMSNLSGKPYLSIIIPSRNDEHGGNALRRMQVSLNSLLEQLEKYRIESELILVDWNPPPDKPLLKDVIKWPDRLKYCTIRVIVVPPSIHQRYEGADKILMNVVAAMNCGIRRARGQFILPRSMDLIYSDELMSYLAQKGLRKDERYRADRCDVERNVVQYNTLDEQLDYCRKNIIKTNVQAPQRAERGLPNLHTMASGDFQLMSRDYWHLLRGYREADIPAAYADGLLSYASYAAGVREVVLKDPMCIYHIDHDNKFTERIRRAKLPLENWLSLPFLPAWVNNKIIGLYRRFLMFFGYKLKSSVQGVPTLDYAEYRKMCRDMVAGKRSYIFNDENWGLGQESLEEFIINTADWDKEYEANR
jgi:hypothetical protein